MAALGWRTVAGALIVAVLLVGILLWSRLPSGTTATWADAASLEALRREGVVYLPGEEIFVVADGEGVLAFRADAQHVPDELVTYCRTSGWFEGLHGEKFDQLGRYAVGPARSGLTRVASRIDGDTVQVDPSIVLATPPRGDPHTKPQGPFCTGSEV